MTGDPLPPAGDADAERIVAAALACLERGDLDEAERLYRGVLKSDPRHFICLHHLGAIAAQRGRLEDACNLLERALEQQPDSAETHDLLGSILQALGRFEAALIHHEKAIAIEGDFIEAYYNNGVALQALHRHRQAAVCYEKALDLDPDYAEAHYNLGTALQALDRPDEALACYVKAIAVDQDYAKAHQAMGHILEKMDRLAPAIASYERVCTLRPDDAEAHSVLGGALAKAGQPARALRALEQAVRLAPQQAEIHNNLGNVFQALDRHADAVGHYAQAIAINPGLAAAHNNLGTALHLLARHEEAAAAHERALTIAPDRIEYQYGLGNALLALDQHEQAIAAYETLLSVKPDHAEAENNLGFALQASNDHAAALGHYEKALALDPDLARARWNESTAHLALGNFETGWKKYESRWLDKELGLRRRNYPQPVWLGEGDLSGKTILLYSEQGFGDTIMFARYVPMVAQRGARVVLEVVQPLRSLFAAIAGVAAICTEGEALPPFDCHCPLSSLPLAFGATAETIPGKTPYLFVAADKQAKWQSFAAEGREQRIGLVWSGNPANTVDRHRSMPLALMRPLLELSDYRFVVLQRELRDGDAQMINSTPGMLNPADRLEDFGDTAAVIAKLDLVITVDSAIAHLAGALGKPVWILLPYAAEWRWMRQRTDSPWYPSARLFRQARAGDWASVVEQVAGALMQRATPA